MAKFWENNYYLQGHLMYTNLASCSQTNVDRTDNAIYLYILVTDRGYNCIDLLSAPGPAYSRNASTDHLLNCKSVSIHIAR